MDDEKNQKIIFIGVIISLVLCLFLQSITSHHAVRRADTQIDCLERELDNARERIRECTTELVECRATVGECSDTVGRIAERLNGDADTLQSVITNLRLVRKEVEEMENALNNFYDKYGRIGYDYSYYDTGVEQ